MADYESFKEALSLLAEAVAKVRSAGGAEPVLVGGGAVEFYTAGGFLSGDLDLVAPETEAIEEALISVGFDRPTGPGQPRRGVFHPGLGMGVEVVSGALMDGQADRARIKVINIGHDRSFKIIPPEDLIADRMAQAVSTRIPDQRMVAQAVLLYRLVQNLDEDYLDKRVKFETGADAGLAILRMWAEENADHGI